jgi:hypothetical protein
MKKLIRDGKVAVLVSVRGMVPVGTAGTAMRNYFTILVLRNGLNKKNLIKFLPTWN